MSTFRPPKKNHQCTPRLTKHFWNKFCIWKQKPNSTNIYIYKYNIVIFNACTFPPKKHIYWTCLGHGNYSYHFPNIRFWFWHQRFWQYEFSPNTFSYNLVSLSFGTMLWRYALLLARRGQAVCHLVQLGCSVAIEVKPPRPTLPLPYTVCDIVLPILLCVITIAGFISALWSYQFGCRSIFQYIAQLPHDLQARR